MKHLILALLAAVFSLSAMAQAQPATVVAVEYYYAAWGYYFETADAVEIAALDGGAFGGLWKRTGQTFSVWPNSNPSASATCRFFSIAFSPKSSHFYTPFPSECTYVKTNPADVAAWQFESIAFYIQLADANGLCSGGTIPLYRLYNNGMGGAPNHRYTTDLVIFNQMVAAGSTFEGNGNTKVFACVPRDASTPSTSPVGIYSGTGRFTGSQTINGLTSLFDTSPYVLGFVTSTGSYMLLSYSTGSPNVVSQIDTGTYSASNGSFTSTNNLEVGLYPNFNSNAFPKLNLTQGGMLSARFLLNTNLTGTIAYPGTSGDVLSFPLSYKAGSATPASLSAIAGTYSVDFYSSLNSGQALNSSAASQLTMSSVGVLSGTVSCPLTLINPPPGPQTPCTVSGTVTARSDLDAYDVSISFANGSSGRFPTGWVGPTATGLGYYDSVSRKFMFGAITPGNIGFAFSN